MGVPKVCSILNNKSRVGSLQGRTMLTNDTMLTKDAIKNSNGGYGIVNAQTSCKPSTHTMNEIFGSH